MLLFSGLLIFDASAIHSILVVWMMHNAEPLLVWALFHGYYGYSKWYFFSTVLLWRDGHRWCMLVKYQSCYFFHGHWYLMQEQFLSILLNFHEYGWCIINLFICASLLVVFYGYEYCERYSFRCYYNLIRMNDSCLTFYHPAG